MVVRSYFYLAMGFNVKQQVSLSPLSNTPDNDGRQLLTGSLTSEVITRGGSILLLSCHGV